MTNVNENDVIYKPWRYQVEFTKKGKDYQSLDSRCFTLREAHANLDYLKSVHTDGYDFRIVERVVSKKIVFMDSKEESLI